MKRLTRSQIEELVYKLAKMPDTAANNREANKIHCILGDELNRNRQGADRGAFDMLLGTMLIKNGSKRPFLQIMAFCPIIVALVIHSRYRIGTI